MEWHVRCSKGDGMRVTEIWQKKIYNWGIDTAKYKQFWKYSEVMRRYNSKKHSPFVAITFIEKKVYYTYILCSTNCLTE